MKYFDEERLLNAAKAKDKSAEDELMRRYRPFVESLTRPYYIVGGDADDLLQIGMIGLLSAVRSFEPERDTSFKTYAARCVRNALLDAVRVDRADKNKLLNDSVPLDSLPSFEDDGLAAADIFASSEPDPEQQYIAKEAEQAFFDALSTVLNETDIDIIKLYLASMPYKEISSKLGVTAKKVDNTIYNAKKKISALLRDL